MIRTIKMTIVSIFVILNTNSHSQGTFEIFTKDDGLTSNKISQIFKDSQGNLWFTATLINSDMEPEPIYSKGVIKYDGQTWTNYYNKNKLAIVNNIFEDSKGTIWIGTDIPGGLVGNGMTKIINSSFETISKVGARYIVEDSKGTIWFGGKKFGSFDGKSVTEYSKKEIGNKNITALYCDQADNIWVGTKKGVSIFDGNKWRIISNVSNCPTKQVNSIISNSNGNIWFGAENGVFRYDGNNWNHYTVKDGLISDATLLLEVDSQNNIYAITGSDINSIVFTGVVREALADKGFSLFENGKWRAFSDVEGVPSNLDLRYFEDRSGNLWFNTFENTIYKYDGITWTAFDEGNGFRADWFSIIFEDSRGNYWFGLDNGLGKFDGQNWSYFTKNSGLPSNSITSVEEDDAGNIWFGSYKGIIKYTPY